MDKTVLNQIDDGKVKQSMRTTANMIGAMSNTPWPSG